jgi:putative endonuclease
LGAADERGGRGDGAGTDGRRALGRHAEELAASFLAREGYVIVDRNHAIRRGEVDLVCREAGVLCFVEVRSRSSEAQGGPEETIGRRKALRVVAAATDWALRHGGLDGAIRFDVVAVTFDEGEPPRIELHRGAFDANGEVGLW